jgi:hypothetical protein
MMRKSTLSLLLILMLCNNSGATDTLIIKKAARPPIINGQVDSEDRWAWSSGWINMTKNKITNTTSAITGKFQLSYDDDNLYLIAVCTGDENSDTSSVTILNSWERDCLEVNVKLDTASGETGAYVKGDYWFIMRRGAFFPDCFDAGQMTCDWRHSNFIIGQTEGSTKYIQEWQMPWAVLVDSAGKIPGWDGKYMKFELMFADNTTGAASGRTQQLFWNSGSNLKSYDSRYFGMVKFITPFDLTPKDTRLSQTISFDWINDKYLGDPDFSLTASTSSGLPVYFTSSNTAVATVVNNTVHIVGIGTGTIVAHQDGNDMYKPASPVGQYFEVIKKNELTITMTANPPKIDGVIDNNDPWSSTWIDMTGNYGANTTSDVTGKFQLTYDENKLYLAVVSTGDKSLDTSSADIPNSYESDCIEVFILMDTSRENDYDYKPGDYQFRMRRGSVFPDRFDHGQLYNNWRNSDFKIGQTDMGTSYMQEWQMPWAVLADSAGMSPAWDGTIFRFDIKISDNTTGAGSGRTQQLFWSQLREYSWRNIQYYGWIKLLATAVKTTKLKEKTIYLNPVNNKLRINTEISEQSIIEIFNIEGKQILTAKISRDKTVDVGFLRAGAYILKIIDGKEIYSGKFIKR